jgi:quercetin dioxygenase-like cupin family protein
VDINERRPAFVAPGTSITGKILNVLGDRVTVKLSGGETVGGYTILEQETDPGNGPPMHVHHKEDEAFYILEGDYEFHVGGRVIRARAGAFLYGPREIPHRFQNVGTARGRMLVFIQPAGIEYFFEEIAAATVDGHPDMEKVGAACRKYEIEFV